MDRHAVTLHMLERSRAETWLEELARALEGGVVGRPDDAGMVDVEVTAPDREDALRQVRDAIAAAGAEEHFTFPETTGTGYRAPGTRGN
jgi:hypothetical protein